MDQEPLAFGLDALGLASFDGCQGFGYLLLKRGIHESASALLIIETAALASG